MRDVLICTVFACLVAVASTGCGESGTAAPAAAPDPQPGDPAEAQPKPAADPPAASPQTPAESAASDGESFEAKLAEAQELRADGQTRSAQILIRMMQRDFASHPRAGELVEISRALNEQRDLEASMAVPLRNLGSDDPDAVRVARQMLRRGGEPVWPLLRRVARSDDANAGIEASILLAEMGNPAAAPLLIERYRAAPTGPQADRLLSSLRTVATSTDPAVIPGIYQRFVAEPTPAFAEVLIAVLTSVAEGDADRFNELAGDAGAMAALRGYVEQQMAAEAAESVAWANTHLAALGIARPGLRAEFYEGTNFEKRVETRRVDTPSIEPGKYPLKRYENVSVKWTGRITVTTPGEHTFYSKSDDGQRVIINGKMVIDDWNYHGPEERTGSIKLAAGQHDFEARWMQGSSGYVYALSWSGPGFEKQPVPADAFTVTPWPGME